MRTVYLILGILLALFTVGQILQLCGLIGLGFSIAGLGITLLAGVGTYACFNKALAGRGA